MGNELPPLGVSPRTKPFMVTEKHLEIAGKSADFS